MTKKIEQFNMVIVGAGGQGLITLLQILAEAAKLEGYDVKTSELHGLSQRGGSVEVHFRFGRKIFSPLVSQGKADLILALETKESLKAALYASPQTIFLINKFQIPIPLQKSLPEKEILKNLKKVSPKLILIPATEISQKETGKGVVAGVFMVSLAAFKNLIPLHSNSILKAIKKVIPQRYFEINERAFETSKDYDKSIHF